jgi:hypothetical protein
MKQFVVGSALLMFGWSLPTGATNDHHTISLEPTAGVQKASFEQFYGDTLPPTGYGVLRNTQERLPTERSLR